MPIPVILGHEGAGIVAEAGEGVEERQAVGERLHWRLSGDAERVRTA